MINIQILKKKLQRICYLKKYPFHEFFIFLLKKKLNLQKDEIAVISIFNSGETFLMCSLLDSFCNKHEIKNSIVLVGTKNYHRQIAEMFPSQISRYYQIDPYIGVCLQYLREIKKGEIFSAYFEPIWKSLNISYSPNQFELLKKIIFLDGDAVCSKPSISKDCQIAAYKKFKDLNLIEGKTVIISPEAVTLKTISSSFWQKLTDQIIKSGFKVFLNSNDKNTLVKNSVTTFLTLPESIIFSKYCGNFIALRSGFCDIVVHSEVKSQIIYSNEKDLKTFSIKNYYKCDHLDEHIYISSEEDKLISILVSNLSKT